MALQCPQCHNSIVIEGPPPREVVCPSCGSSIQLDPHATSGWLPEESPKRLGKFEFLEQLGVGSFGTVYKARDTELDRIVAVKIPRSGSIPKQEDLDRFLREARSAAQLKHHGIVALYDAGHIDGTCCLVSEFIHGATLAQHRSAKRFGFRQAAELIAEVADALHYAHEHGVIHRDIKSSNIMLDLDGRPHLMDFGLAKRAADEITMTLEGQVLGTPAYMSPEQAKGEVRQVDARSDIYGLGVVLYELLTGELPFRGQTRMLLMQVIQDEPKPPRRLNDKIPKDLETICLKTMAKEPGRRYQTARDLADDLGRFLRGEAIQARPVSQMERLWRWGKRNPVIAGLIGAVILLTTTGFTATLGQMQKAKAKAEEAMQQRNETRMANEKLLATQDELRSTLYAAHMNLVQAAWDVDHVGRVRELLSAQVPKAGETDLRGFEWYYWQRLVHFDHLMLVGHKGRVTAVTFAPDGQRLVTAGADGTARVWDASSGREMRCLRGHRSEVTAVAFAPHGQWLVTGSTDGTARIWDAASGRELQTLQAQHPSPVRAVAVIPDGKRVVTGSEDGLARVWDAPSGQQLLNLQGHTGPVWAVTATPDGRRLVTGSGDRTARVWDAVSGRELLPPLEHAGEVLTVAVSANGKQLVTGNGIYHLVTLWDAASGRELQVLGSSNGYQSIILTPDGKRVISGSRVWDTATGRVIPNQARWGGCRAISPDGQRLAQGRVDGTARVWDIASGRETLTLKGHSDDVNSVAVTRDGRRVVTGSDDGTVRIWDAASGQQLLTLQPHTALPILAASMVSLLSAPQAPGPFLAVSALCPATTGVVCVAVTADTQRIVTGGADGTARVWDAVSGRELLRLEGHTGVIRAVAVTPDGQRIVTGGQDGTARVWDAVSGRPLLELNAHFGWVLSVTVTPDGQRLVTGGWDDAARVWDMVSGHLLLELKGNSLGGVWSVTVTLDGQWILTGASDGTVRIWDAASGRELLSPLKGHSGTVRSIAVTADGQRIVSGGEDGTARLWDAVSGRELLTMKAHTGPVWSVAVTSEGRRMITGSADGTVKIWEAASPDQIALWTRQEEEAARRLAPWQPPAAGAPGFIQDWLVMAPLPLEASQWAEELEREQLQREARLQPRAGDRVWVGGREYTWQEHREKVPILDFNRLAGKLCSQAVAYAVCYVISEAERKDLLLQVGHDDQAKVYLNGQEIYKHSLPNALNRLDPIGPVTLRKGTNVLVLKVVNQGSDWLGCARFVDPEDNPAEGLRVSLTPE
jgi:WD40 repeat protein/tRNA A-37 threonylcarbamoyl transferase component Bud32